jgi:ribonuclease G
MPHTECVAGEEQKQFTVRDISELVRQGQDLMVQVVKDPLGTKGARLTTDITLPSRYLVFMPGASHVGVSQRIESESERERLKTVVSAYCDEQGGFIIRTAAEGISEEDLASDAAYLKRVWTKVMERKKRNQTRYQLYGELALAQRVLRDFADAQLDRIRVDSRLTYEALLEFTGEYIPEMPGLLEHYAGKQPIFDLYDVENEIQRALERKVELKSGGYLIIDQTEAMTTVDINTGAFVGHRNLDDTIFNTNIEATQAIARQLRLRNLGGIIIIDFIDMNNEDHRRRVLHSLRQQRLNGLELTPQYRQRRAQLVGDIGHKIPPHLLVLFKGAGELVKVLRQLAQFVLAAGIHASGKISRRQLVGAFNQPFHRSQ